MIMLAVMKTISLSEFIAEIGDEEAGRLFGVSARAAKSWRLRDRYPRPETADRIVVRTSGRVTHEGIYGGASSKSDAA